MTSAAVYREALAAAIAAETVSSETKITTLGAMAAIALRHGVQADADMVLIAMPQDDIVVVGLLVGKSLRFASTLRDILTEYLPRGDAEYAKVTTGFIADAADRFEVGDPHFIMVLQHATSEAWRSFRDVPLLIADAIVDRARQAGQQPIKRISDPTVN